MVGVVKDYDCTIKYHPRRANVVADALSRKSKSSTSSLNVVKVALLKEFRNGAPSLRVTSDGVLLAHFQLRPKLVDEVVKKQLEDHVIKKLMEKVKV